MIILFRNYDNKKEHFYGNTCMISCMIILSFLWLGRKINKKNQSEHVLVSSPAGQTGPVCPKMGVGPAGQIYPNLRAALPPFIMFWLMFYFFIFYFCQEPAPLVEKFFSFSRKIKKNPFFPCEFCFIIYKT